MNSPLISTDPHAGAQIFTAGESVESSRLVVICLHGRGGSARDILSVVAEAGEPDTAYLAPQAIGASWYPHSFLAPIDHNQPGIDSAHRMIDSLISSLTQNRTSPVPVALLGFSQGACLAVDHAFRFPQQYAFVASLTGGLIGHEGSSFEPQGSLNGTPVFLGASTPDPHVPWPRVEESADALRIMEAEVDLVPYPNAPHAVLPQQIVRVNKLVRDALSDTDR